MFGPWVLGAWRRGGKDVSRGCVRVRVSYCRLRGHVETPVRTLEASACVERQNVGRRGSLCHCHCHFVCISFCQGQGARCNIGGQYARPVGRAPSMGSAVPLSLYTILLLTSIVRCIDSIQTGGRKGGRILFIPYTYTPYTSLLSNVNVQ